MVREGLASWLPLISGLVRSWATTCESADLHQSGPQGRLVEFTTEVVGPCTGTCVPGAMTNTHCPVWRLHLPAARLSSDDDV